MFHPKTTGVIWGIEDVPEIPLGIPTAMRAAHIESVNEIYVTWGHEAHVKKLEKLNDPSLPAIPFSTDIKMLDYCKVRYPGDHLNKRGMQRGQVIARYEVVGDRKYRVRLVDVGRSFDLPKEAIYVLDTEFYSFKRRVVRFGMVGFSTTSTKDLDQRAASYASSMLGTRAMKCVVAVTHLSKVEASRINQRYKEVTKLWGTFFTVEKDNVGKFLLHHGFVIPRQATEIKNKLEFVRVECPHAAAKKAYLYHHETFQGQLVGDTEGMDYFSVTKHHEFPLLAKVQVVMHQLKSVFVEPYEPWNEDVGPMCVARYPGRKYLERGRVMSIDEDRKATVRLLDTAERCLIPFENLKNMPDSLRCIKPLAYRCRLPISPMMEDGWDEEAVDRFLEFDYLNASKGMTISVLKVSQASHVVDIKMVKEKTTWCLTLLDINEAKFNTEFEHLRPALEKLEEDQFPYHCPEEREANKAYWMQIEANENDYPYYVDKLEDDIYPSESLETNDQQYSVANNNKEPMYEEVIVGKMSDLTLNEFDYSKMKKIAPLSEELGKRFLLTGVVGYDVVNLIDAVDGCEKKTDLESIIKPWILSGKGDLQPNEMPPRRSVVLAKYSTGNYERALLEEVQFVNKTGWAFIRFLEQGSAVKLPLKELKHISQEAFDVQEMVHTVRVEGIGSEIPVLSWHYEALMEVIGHTVILGPEMPFGVNRLPVVVLYANIQGTNRRLSVLINDLQIWMWQKYLRAMHLTFSDILNQFQLTQQREIKHFLHDRPIQVLMRRTKFNLKVREVELYGDHAVLSGIPSDSHVSDEFRTVQKQIALFMEKVQYYVMIPDEIPAYKYLIAVRNDQAIKQLSSPCYWHRCFYDDMYDNNLKCVDCFWESELCISHMFSHHEIRPLTPDFFDASPIGMSVEIDVSWLKPEVRASAVEVLFAKGKEISVMLLDPVKQCKYGKYVFRARSPGAEVSARRLLDTNAFSFLLEFH